MDTAINEDKLNELLGKVVGDIGAAMSTSLVVIGEALGLYKGLAQAPCTPQELADKTSTKVRYVQEWLNNQTAGCYVSYNSDTEKYYMTPEQNAAFADESSPAYMPGVYSVISATIHSEPHIRECFKTGEGLAWGDQHQCLFVGTEKFFKASYIGNLIDNWLPAMSGATEKLAAGCKVADVGCGLGASTIIMAEAYPNSTFYGFDYHEESIQLANERAKERGLSDRVKFEVADATSFPDKGYDIVTTFDCFHDLGNPLGAAKRVSEVLDENGLWMIVEPFANDKAEDNHNPIGRIFYGASTMVCVPCSLALDGPALGAQAGQHRLTEIIKAGGFDKVRKATQTPFNLILEAKL